MKTIQTVELLVTLVSDSGKQLDYRLVLDRLGGSAEFTNEDTRRSFLKICIGGIGEREVKEADTMRISL